MKGTQDMNATLEKVIRERKAERFLIEKHPNIPEVAKEKMKSILVEFLTYTDLEDAKLEM